MAIQRPLRWDNTLSALKEMSDTELEQMAYYLRYQWGQDLLGTYTTDCARDSGASVNSGFGHIEPLVLRHLHQHSRIMVQIMIRKKHPRH